jgi:uncharacterized membrane protein
MSEAKKKTSTGLEENVAGLLCYVLGWVTGIIFLILEKENQTVRFHAIQSIIIFGALTVLDMVFGWIPIINFFVWIFSVIAFILWIILMVTAYQGKKLKIWIAGSIAEKNSQPKAS